MMPSKANPFGISIIRHETTYEESTIFQGYPGETAWYPFSSDIYEEVIPSMGDMYPIRSRPCSSTWDTGVLAPRRPHEPRDSVRSDQDSLVVCSDITVGTTSVYADYIFPDLTLPRALGVPGSHPSIAPRCNRSASRSWRPSPRA